MDDFIQLKKDNIVRIGIKEYDGKETGEHLEFDLEDIDLLLNYQECIERHKKNIDYYRRQLVIISKREDKKNKKLLSYNQEEEIKLLKEFYKREEEALDLFLGENGTKKILNGRKPYFSMYEDILEVIEPVLPIIEKSFNLIKSQVKNKYSVSNKDNKVIE